MKEQSTTSTRYGGIAGDLLVPSSIGTRFRVYYQLVAVAVGGGAVRRTRFSVPVTIYRDGVAPPDSGSRTPAETPSHSSAVVDESESLSATVDSQMNVNARTVEKDEDSTFDVVVVDGCRVSKGCRLKHDDDETRRDDSAASSTTMDSEE